MPSEPFQKFRNFTLAFPILEPLLTVWFGLSPAFTKKASQAYRKMSCYLNNWFLRPGQLNSRNLGLSFFFSAAILFFLWNSLVSIKWNRALMLFFVSTLFLSMFIICCWWTCSSVSSESILRKLLLLYNVSWATCKLIRQCNFSLCIPTSDFYFHILLQSLCCSSNSFEEKHRTIL